jgi:hypothetical protein
VLKVLNHLLFINEFIIFAHIKKTNMEEAIKDIRDWAEKYGDGVCLNRLLEIMQDQWKNADVKRLAEELWEYNH